MDREALDLLRLSNELELTVVVSRTKPYAKRSPIVHTLLMNVPGLRNNLDSE
jgi:hypothetical protein